MSGASIAAIIGVVAALVLALHAMKAHDVRPRQAFRLALIWIAIFVVLFVIVSRFLG